jgi:hypothetical protein
MSSKVQSISWDSPFEVNHFNFLLAPLHAAPGGILAGHLRVRILSKVSLWSVASPLFIRGFKIAHCTKGCRRMAPKCLVIKLFRWIFHNTSIINYTVHVIETSTLTRLFLKILHCRKKWYFWYELSTSNFWYFRNCIKIIFDFII